MPLAHMTGSPRAALQSLAAKLTGVLGYFHSRDALEKVVYNQLTIARQTKARQVETYFRTIGSELRLLSTSQMVIDATREFRIAVDQLDRGGAPPELRRKVGDWYAANFVPQMKSVLGREPPLLNYLPVGGAPYYLQYHYIVENPNPPERRKLLDDAGDGSEYSKLHAIYHPLMRTAATTVGFFDFMIGDPKSGRLIYTVQKEVDFTTSLRLGPHRRSNVATAVARCSETADPSAICLEDFAPYAPSGGAPIACMGAPVLEQGVVTGVLIAQLSNDEIDNVVTSGRRWRQDGFGDTGEAYLVGSDYLVRSSPRASAHRHRCNSSRARRCRGHRRDHWIPWRANACLMGTACDSRRQVDARRKDRHRRGLRADRPAPPGAADCRGLVLLAVASTAAWLSRVLLGPLRELTAGVKSFAAGDYGARVPVRTRDEIGQLCLAFNGMVEDLRQKNTVIENKNCENEELLLNVLPARLPTGCVLVRRGSRTVSEVTVAFADLVGFTALTSEMPPQEVVTFLNGLFTRFDVAATDLGIEKIKTVGDAYMAVCGLPEPVANHTERMVRMAIRMVHITREHAMEHNISIKLRVGVNCGPVVAGIIGKSKYIYDLWGDTVNLASRMESGSIPDAVQVTRAVYEQLKHQFVFEPRGPIEVKGKGKVEAWLLRL